MQVSVYERRGGTHRRAGLHSTVLQTTVTAGRPERTRLVQVHLQQRPVIVMCVCYSNLCVCVCVSHFVEPEIV